MPNYIVTLELNKGCYTFMCTDRNPYIARQVINMHANTIDFYGDPDVVEISEKEFELFQSKGVEVVVNEMD